MASGPSSGLAPLALRRSVPATPWRVSWPLIVAAAVYLYAIADATSLLMDGDTLWHIAAGQWVFEHGAVPTQDPFSHTMRGAPWVAHEWLAEVLFAAAYRAGGFAGVVALAAGAFALAMALLARFLLRWFEPIHVALFTMLALKMAAVHLLARPDVLVLPLMVWWASELVDARCQARAPRPRLIAAMVLWANLHGSFTFALALALFFAFEAVVQGARARRGEAAARWGAFLFLAVAGAALTPHPWDGFHFTWKVLVDNSHALDLIEEWRSPDFHQAQPLELWLLGLVGLALVQGIRVPALRVILLLGLVHLALRHQRHAALLGVLSPIVLAPALAAHWNERRRDARQLHVVDRALEKLAAPAGAAAVVALLALLPLSALVADRLRPFEPPVPASAVRAARAAGLDGPVLNTYDWGGYLVFLGIPPFIDGRADMYGDKVLKDYLDLVAPTSAADMQRLLDKYGIQWTLLEPRTAALAALDLAPGWRRVHSDGKAVVHARVRGPFHAQQPRAVAGQGQ